MIKIVTIEREVDEKICKRCLGSWFSKVPDPKVCALCKSPYWKKDRLRTGAVGAVNKYGFDAIALNKWAWFPLYCDPKQHMGLDHDANYRRSKSLEQYLRRKGWHYTHKFGKNEAGEVGLMVMRTK